MPASRRFQHLYDILKTLQEKEFAGENEIWSLLLEKTAQAVAVKTAVFFAWDFQNRQLCSVRYCDPSLSGTVPLRFDSFKGICGWVAENRKTVLSNHPLQDARFDKTVDLPWGLEAAATLTVPVLRREDLFGVLHFIRSQGGGFDAEDAQIAELASAQAAILAQIFRMRQALGRVTAHNASILENLTGGFIGMDLQGNVMIINPRAREILEIGEHNVVGQPVEAALNTCPGLVLVLKECLARNHTVKRQELPWMHRNRKRLLGYSTLLIQDVRGGVAGAGVTFQDLTQLK